MSDLEQPVLDPRSVDYNIEALTRHTIDQAVIDGEVSGIGRRVPYAILTRVAFQGVAAPDEVHDDFRQALEADDRFIDRIKKKYAYQQALSDGSTVRPSILAILKGRSLCTEEERTDALQHMDTLAVTLFAHSDEAVLSTRDISGILNAAGFDITYEAWGAFLHYLEQDPRFHRARYGQQVVLQGRGVEPETSAFQPLVPKQPPPRTKTSRPGRNTNNDFDDMLNNFFTKGEHRSRT